MISLKILNFVNRRRKRLCKKKSLKEKQMREWMRESRNAWILIFWQQCNIYEMNLIKPRSLRFHTAQIYCGWELTYFFVILFFFVFFWLLLLHFLIFSFCSFCFFCHVLFIIFSFCSLAIFSFSYSFFFI